MPIVINKDTGLAENLPDAESALNADTHEVPLYNPKGEFVSVPYTQASRALSEGYTQPNSQQLAHIHKQGKYGTTEQQLKAFAEGAAEASTFGLSTDVERALGVNPKDIRGRREVNPVAQGAGQAAGLIGSMMTGVGEGALLGRAARVIVPESIGQVGSTIARAAAENAMFESGDEVSQMFASDPGQFSETAMAHIGMAGLVGGGFGAAGAAWSAGPGKKLSTIMGALRDRSGGIPEELRVATGIEVPPLVKAALSDNEYAQRAFVAAQEGSSSSDKVIQKAYKEFNENMTQAASKALGKSADDIEHIIGRNVSEYETGKEVKDALVKQFKDKYEPIQQSYDNLAEKFKKAPVSDELKAEMANRVTQTIADMGLEKASSTVPLKAAQDFLLAIPKQETANDLKLLAQNLKTKEPELFGLFKSLKGIAHEVKDKALSANISSEAPELMSQFKQTQAQYGGIKELIEDLNSRIHVGKSGGPDSFVSNMKEAAPEVLLRRLGPKGDKELGMLMEKEFPEVSQLVKAQELNKVVQASGKDGTLNLKKLFNNLERMGEDLRNYAVPQESQKQLAALKQMMDRVPDGSSFSQKIADKLWSKVPPAAAGVIGLLTHLTNNPIANFVIGNTVGHLAHEAKGGARLALLKFLGSSAEISAEGLNAAAQLANAAAKGESKLNMSVKNVFSTGGKVIPMPKASSLEKLDKQVKLVADNDPESQENMLGIGGHTGHYLPDHGAMLAMLGSRNIQYLASLRPVEKSLSPLEPDPVPNATQKGKYQRALQIAQQPLVVLNSVKDGSLTLEDKQHLEVMYPALLARMSQKLFSEMTDKATKGKELPYDTKMGLSSFLGQPLDSSMSQQSIMSTQTRLPASQQPMQEPNAQPRLKNADKLDKMPGMYRTPQQSRQMQKSQGS